MTKWYLQPFWQLGHVGKGPDGFAKPHHCSTERSSSPWTCRRRCETGQSCERRCEADGSAPIACLRIEAEIICCRSGSAPIRISVWSGGTAPCSPLLFSRFFSTDDKSPMQHTATSFEPVKQDMRRTTFKVKAKRRSLL